MMRQGIGRVGKVGRPRDSQELRDFKRGCRQMCLEAVEQMSRRLEKGELKAREMQDLMKFCAAYGFGTPLPVGADEGDPMVALQDLPRAQQKAMLQDRLEAYAKALRVLNQDEAS